MAEPPEWETNDNKNSTKQQTRPRPDRLERVSRALAEPEKNERRTVSSLFQNLRSGLTVTEFLDTFPMKNGRNVTAVLQYIIEQLREELTTGSDSIVSDARSVDWRDYPGIEVNAKGHTNGWVFKGTERSVAELFEHIAEGGSTCGYYKRFPEVRPADVAGLLNFLVTRLDSI